MNKNTLLGAVLLGVMGFVGFVNAGWAGGMPSAVPEDALRTAIFQAPPAVGTGTPSGVQASSGCTTFKWDRACSSTSQQDCQASCGSCAMCLDVIQFYPCVYECSCSC